MRNYIILNNQNSNTISGLIVQELAPISKPLQRTQVETIDGRDGDIVTPLGYAAYNKKIKIGLYGNFNINDIIAYFATKGTVIFSNEPDKYYYYQIVDQIDYERLVRYRVATVTMHVQPFKYSATEGTITVDASDTVSGEGSDIALDGTAEAPFNVLRHKGNATQDDTPTPDNPIDIKVLTGNSEIEIRGKNLFNFEEFAQDKIKPSGVTRGTATYTGNSITITATANDAYTRVGYNQGYPPIIKVPKNTNMVLSWKTDTVGAVKGLVYIFGINASGGADVIINAQDLAGERTFNTGDYDKISFRLGVNTAGNSITYSDIMLEYGTMPTSFEPYQAQLYEVNLGKNLLDLNSLTATGIVVSNGVATGTARAFNAAYGVSSGVPASINSPQVSISLKAYTDAETVGTNNGLKIRAIYKDGTGSDIISFTNDITTPTYKSAITSATKEIDKIVITYGNLPDNTWHISEFQIEAGGKITPYAPYFTPIELAAIGDYADEPVNVDGTWYIRRAIGKVVLDGTSKSVSSPSEFPNLFMYKSNNIGYTDTIGLCVYYVNNPNGAGSNNSANGLLSNGEFCFRTGTLDRIYFKDTRYSTVTDMNTWLSTHNTTVYYALATPTDEAITDQDLIDALDELYDQAHAYKGHTHITATAADGNAPAVLSVEVGEDNESTVTNAGNTTSRPILTIYGQGDIGVYINDVEVLDVALGDEQYITLDSVEMEAYKDTTANLKNRLVTGDYSKLALNAGANKIYFTGKVTKYEISKYSRWL